MRKRILSAMGLHCPAAAVVVAVVAGAAGASDRLDVFGVGTANGGWTLLDPAGYAEAMFDTMAQVGATSTRLGANWSTIEAVRGVYDWHELDEDVDHCLARGIRPYCLIVNTPGWASPTGQPTHVLRRGQPSRLADLRFEI